MIVQASPKLFSVLMEMDRPSVSASQKLANALKYKPLNDRTLRADQIKPIKE
jgi:hypothetical protein